MWDAASYSKFKNNRSYIQTYIDYYLQAGTHYRERFGMLIEKLNREDTKPIFPTYIKRKGSNNGLLDYFFNGTPDDQLSKQIREKEMGIDEGFLRYPGHLFQSVAEIERPQQACGGHSVYL